MFGFGYKFSKEVLNWLKKISKETLPEDIVAINIGMFESKNGYCLYLIGARNYDDENSDWAASNAFVPKDKYLVVKNKKINSLEWRDFLELVGRTLKDIQNSENFNSLVLNKVKHVTYGFDDGDLQVLF